MNRSILAAIFGVLVWVSGCKLKNDDLACKPVQKITPQTDCYNSTQGLTLVASGQTTQRDQTQLIWSIFPQKDTTLTNDISGPRENVLVGNTTLVVPDSLLKNVPKIVVKVSFFGCGPSELHSVYHVFVRRTANGSNCSVWQKREL